MAETPKTDIKTIAETLSPARLAEAQKRNAAFFREAGELTTKTARALWESQTELLRLEAEEATKGFTLPKSGENPAAMMSACCTQQHERTERMIAHMRKTNDLVRDYGWQLLSIYTSGFSQVTPEGQTPPVTPTGKA